MSWDKNVDIVVVGSGAGGLLTALVAASNRAEVLVVEKDRCWGGTSATSGGGIWIPGSDQARAAGFNDDLDAAFRYVRALSADNVPDAQIRAFVDNAAPMLRWVTANTELVYTAQPYPDYHAENDGGSVTGYRTHLPETFDGALLGPDLNTQRFPSPAASLWGTINWTFAETYALLYRGPGWWKTMGRMLTRYWLDWPRRFSTAKDRRLTLGNALTGGLRYALNAAGGQVWLRTPMQELVHEDGRVVGIVVEKDGKPFRIRTRKGVVLASGGFDKNKAMREANAPLYRETHLSGGVGSNTGDGIAVATALGAATRNLQSAWAAPVFYVPGEDRGRLCTIERALPGCIMVNQRGQRYLNEAASYHVTGQIMARRHAAHGDASPSWMVFDGRYRRQFPMGPLFPVIPDWAQPGAVKAILKKGRTIEELATAMGVDPATLTVTITRFNQHADEGQDPDFHRGEAAYDRMYGDYRHQPNPCLRSLTEAPFYALPIYPGDIGTNGGIVTNERAQVLSESGAPISGLYAIGNTTASPMGESYPGAGVTLGPAMTFGYIAARELTGAND